MHFYLIPILAIVILSAAPAQARTWVIPHVFETKGRVSTEQNVFDTDIIATFLPAKSTSESGATLEVYLFDQNTGQPMTGASGSVCTPCVYVLDAARPKLQISFDEIITGSAGGFDQNVKLGFAVIVAGGTDPDAVNLQAFVINSRTSAFDLSVFGFEPQEVKSTLAPRMMGFPHFVQTAGVDLSYRFDSQIFALYSGGKADIPDGDGAQVDLFLYDQSTGRPLTNNEGADVCNPCTVSLSSAQPKASFNFRSLINAPPGGPPKTGFGIVRISGPDPDHVHLQGILLNTQDNAFDVGISDLNLQPVGEGSPRGTFVLPHIIETSGTTVNANSFDSGFAASYSGGLAGIPASKDGAQVDLHLFDQSTGQPLRGANGSAICDPCTLSFNEANRKRFVRIDDLIQENGGGFDQPVKTSFAILLTSGDTENLSLQGFILNSHTGPFDLSVFGYEPPLLDPEPRRSFVIPHILETKGRVSADPYSFDTTIFATYGAGLAGIPPGPGATLDIRLFNSQTGLPLQAPGGAVCDPCTFELSSAQPGTSITIQFLLDAAGFAEQVVQAYATLDLSGDVTNVILQAFVVNAHTGPFDLSVFGFDPQPILASPGTVKPPVLTAAEAQQGAFTFSFQTVSGENYVIEGVSRLDATRWIQLGEMISGTGQPHKFQEPATGARKFYRARAVAP